MQYSNIPVIHFFFFNIVLLNDNKNVNIQSATCYYLLILKVYCDLKCIVDGWMLERDGIKIYMDGCG